jgi:prophage DNA circulation protein
MPTIRELPSAWRERLLPAHFDGRMFHVESGSRESGRRVVVHEFPKKEDPYSEDMGKRAIAFTVRGYCIVYPHDDPSATSLYRQDYQIARDALIERLETGGTGVLQLPTLAPLKVKCQRYRITEEEKTGGYCVFDMQFIEAGVQPFMPNVDTATNLRMQADQLKQQVASVWAAQRAKTGLEDTRLKFLTGPPPPSTGTQRR